MVFIYLFLKGRFSKQISASFFSTPLTSNPLSPKHLEFNGTRYLTSEAKANRFLSPPEIPLSLPGIPMNVSAHFFKPS